MSLGLSICWRGPPGSGKRYALQNQLQMWTKSIGQIYSLKKQLWDAPVQGGNEKEDVDDDDEKEKVLLPMETSILHWGFDVSRMSLQDKQFIKSIISKWGRGSQVLASSYSQRCLVFYHAHLLSSESVLFLQAFLEENHKDTVLWLTSEFPLPQRLADWCLEIPVAGKTDLSLAKIKKQSPHLPILTMDEEIQLVYKSWQENPATLSDVKKIKAIVYGLLHRNIRWTEGFHLWMFALDNITLTQEQKRQLAQVFITQPFTGSGQTVPSYRIPILWENFLLLLRNILGPQAPIKKIKKTRKVKGSE